MSTTQNPLLVRVLAVSLAPLFLAAGCASAPTTQASTQAAPMAVAGTSHEADTGAKTGSKQDEFKPPSGYVAKVIKGEQVYCHNEVIIGSRLPHRVCYSQYDLEEIERRKDSMRQNVEKGQRSCTNMQACGGY